MKKVFVKDLDSSRLGCQASKTAFRSRVLSEYPAARARASYWFDNRLGSPISTSGISVNHGELYKIIHKLKIN